MIHFAEYDKAGNTVPGTMKYVLFKRYMTGYTVHPTRPMAKRGELGPSIGLVMKGWRGWSAMPQRELIDRESFEMSPSRRIDGFRSRDAATVYILKIKGLVAWENTY